MEKEKTFTTYLNGNRVVVPYSERHCNFSIMTYASEEEIKNLCNHVRHYAYIYHDKEECTPHYHVLLNDNSLSANKILKLLNSTQNTFFELTQNNFNAFHYLTHDNTDKVRYDESEIYTDKREFFLGYQNSKESDNEEFLNDLLTLSKLNMALKYGRDFIKNAEKYYQFAFQIKEEFDLQKKVDLFFKE